MVNAFFLFCGCVDQASVAVVEKWGRFLRLADPGLHFFNPFAGECVAGALTTRVQSLDVRVETKTKVRLAAFGLPLIPSCSSRFTFSIARRLRLVSTLSSRIARIPFLEISLGDGFGDGFVSAPCARLVT